MTVDSKLMRLAPQSLGELAYNSIRDSIVSGRFNGGERLVESRLADELGISRAPVREALRRLGEERLVVERPRHGTFVREFVAQDFVDIYNVRIAIETTAIRLVTRRGDSVEALEKLVEKMRRAAERDQPQEVVDLELRLHETLCEMSQNSYLAAVYRSLSAQIRMALGLDDAEYADLEEIVAEHGPVLDAIRSGDEMLAADVLQRHILATVGPVLARLGGNADDLLALNTPPRE